MRVGGCICYFSCMIDVAKSGLVSDVSWPVEHTASLGRPSSRMALMTDGDGSALIFGPFRLSVRERRLEREGAAVPLGSRAFDVLVALAARAGEVVSKQDLTAYVWPDTAVEESGLRVHIAALRKALGDAQGRGAYISNVPGRGYCFVAQVTRASRPPRAGQPQHGAEQRRSSLPLPLTTMVGREDAILRISAELREGRFLSIVGPGGMGKTTVAVAVGHALLGEFAGKAHFVDLGALSDAAHVLGSVASAVGAIQKAGDTIASLVEFFRDQRMLLVIDSCEHVVETVAPLLEAVFHGTEQIYILTTGREPLRVEGERVHRLAPLECPPSGALLDAPEALTYSAVRLFLERATAGGRRVELSNSEASLIAEICRRLDGIALAIEFAASRVEAYGIKGTASLLENRFRLQWQGRRTALPRHQTLDAMIDWSYCLLTEWERLVLRRSSIFAGSFSLAAAATVLADGSVDAERVIDALDSLVDKSLVSVDAGGQSARYRLLDTTRAYARSKLEGAGEARSVAQRHAEYFCGVLDAASALAEHLGNVRAASEIVERLRLHAEKYALGPYHSVALGLNGELLIKRGEFEGGIEMVRSAMTVLRAERHEILCTVFATAIAEGLGNLGQYDEALATIDEAIAEGALKNGAFDMPEMLRVKGQLLATAPARDRQAAERCLLSSLECASSCDSLAWELRTATSLARLWAEQGAPARARDALAPVYGQFAQGFETADLRAARTLLDKL